MKSPHANPPELKALSAVPQAPFPLTPAAAAIKPAGTVKLAALKRLRDEEEKTLTDSVPEEGQALAEDGITSEGAALEAIAPAPLPEMSGMDTLLAQAGPAATGGAAGGGGIPTGLVVGAVVVLAAAASGGSSSPAPAPAPAPAGPPNQPASINASEPMRTGFVVEDYVPGDGEMMLRDGDFEYTGTTGNTAATALKIVDADGGADLTFRAATAEELQGKYGNFTFDAATGLWTYTINNDDPDTQALGAGGKMAGRGKEGYAEAYDYLTVYSKDGTASTVIEVGVLGKGEPPVLGGDTGVTVGSGEMALVELTAMAESGAIQYYQSQSPSRGSVQVFNDGGFALFFADGEFESNYQDSFGYQARAQEDNGYAYGEVTVNVIQGSLDESESTPGFGDGSFSFEGTEGQASSISFRGMLEDADDDGDGIFTLILDAQYAYDDGHFVMSLDETVRVLGNGTSEVALQGTLDALQAFLEAGNAKFLVNSEYEADNIDFKTWLYDGQGNYASGYFEMDGFNEVNDLPSINAYLGEGHEPATPTYYVPATGTADAGSPFQLGNSFLYIALEDEEAWNDYGDDLYLTLSVDAGTLSLLEYDGQTLFDRYGGSVQVWDSEEEEWVTGEAAAALAANAESIMLRSQYYYMLNTAINEHLGFQGPGSFAAGTQTTLTLAFEDAGEDAVTTEIALVASAANTGPFYSITTGFSFPDFTIVTNGEGEDGPASRLTTATATLHEDQHLTLTGIAVNDFESMGSSKVAMYVSAYEFYMVDDERETEGGVGLFYIDDAWQDLVDYNYNGGIALYGSIDDINAMFAAGGLHYALPPDYDANSVYVDGDQEYAADLGFNIDVYDFESTGYGYGSAMLQMDINLVAVNDIPLVLAEAEQYVAPWFDGEFVYLRVNEMLDDSVVFDAEYNGNGDGGTLDITSLVLVAGTGTGTVNFVEGDEDGEWQYTLGEGDEIGDTIEFTYSYTDGTYSGTNTLNLILDETMPT
ncbi:MAG: VCBS domain-containing protein [Pseudomonadota bacterium]